MVSTTPLQAQFQEVNHRLQAGFTSDTTLNDCLNNVRDASLQEWVMRHFDLLLLALTRLETEDLQPHVKECIRRCRIEICIANRLDCLG